MTTQNHFTVWQSVLPVQLGLSIEEIRARRDKFLEKGRDWTGDHKRILFSLEGVKRLVASLALPLDDDLSKKGGEQTGVSSEGQGGAIVCEMPPQKKAAEPIEVDLIVIRCLTNPHLLEAWTPGPGEKVMVHVPSNAHFVPRMALKARNINGRWELAGRCPRFKGRY